MTGSAKSAGVGGKDNGPDCEPKKAEGKKDVKINDRSH